MDNGKDKKTEDSHFRVNRRYTARRDFKKATIKQN